MYSFFIYKQTSDIFHLLPFKQTNLRLFHYLNFTNKFNLQDSVIDQQLKKNNSLNVAIQFKWTAWYTQDSVFIMYFKVKMALGIFCSRNAQRSQNLAG